MHFPVSFHFLLFLSVFRITFFILCIYISIFLVIKCLINLEGNLRWQHAMWILCNIIMHVIMILCMLLCFYAMSQYIFLFLASKNFLRYFFYFNFFILMLSFFLSCCLFCFFVYFPVFLTFKPFFICNDFSIIFFLKLCIYLFLYLHFY